METLKVCDAVNWQIELSGIKSQDAQIVKTCISRYTQGSSKGSVGEKMMVLFNQMCNHIKSMFGKSDWQLAEKAIVKNIYSYVPSFCRDYVKNKTEAQVHVLAGRTLKFLVWENTKKMTVPSSVKTLVDFQLKMAESQLNVMKKNAGKIALNILMTSFPAMYSYGKLVQSLSDLSNFEHNPYLGNRTISQNISTNREIAIGDSFWRI